MYHTGKTVQGEEWLGEIAAANHNGIKDVRCLLPVHLRDHVPLACGGKVGAFLDADNGGLKHGSKAESPLAPGMCGERGSAGAPITHPKFDVLPEAKALGIGPQVVQELGMGQKHREVLWVGEVGER